MVKVCVKNLASVLFPVLVHHLRMYLITLTVKLQRCEYESVNKMAATHLIRQLQSAKFAAYFKLLLHIHICHACRMSSTCIRNDTLATFLERISFSLLFRLPHFKHLHQKLHTCHVSAMNLPLTFVMPAACRARASVCRTYFKLTLLTHNFVFFCTCRTWHTY